MYIFLSCRILIKLFRLYKVSKVHQVISLMSFDRNRMIVCEYEVCDKI